MKVTVRNSVADILAFVRHVRERNGRFRRASAEKLETGRMNTLSNALHPSVQRLQITSRTQETPSTFTFRFVPAKASDRIAFFRAGQYLALSADIAGVQVSRPFSISSPPDESLNGNYYDITIRGQDDGFFAPWAIRTWQEGTTVMSSDPQGFFHYERLRDSNLVVGLAGGSGVTPFRSLVTDLIRNEPDVSIVLFYGVTSPDEIIFDHEWHHIAREAAERFTFIPVLSGKGAWQGETGLLDADLIRKHVPDIAHATLFVCGPGAMHRFLESELSTLPLRQGRIRRENYGEQVADVTGDTDIGARTVTISVLTEGGTPVSIPADPRESVLVALERAGLNPPALCRSGECGWCRSRLISGEVIPMDTPGLRAADRKFGYFHPCSSRPVTDLSIRIPKNPQGR